MADLEREMSFYNYLTRLDHRAELAMDSVTAGIFSCKIVGFMLHAMKSPSRVRALHFTVFCCFLLAILDSLP